MLTLCALYLRHIAGDFSQFFREVTASIAAIAYKEEPKKPSSDEYSSDDREQLLLFMANSYHKAGKLRIEKKTPDATMAVLVFQLKNGNLRYTLNDNAIPSRLRPQVVEINSARINYKNNKRLIMELISEGVPHEGN
jgi:hypothetical protein